MLNGSTCKEGQVSRANLSCPNQAATAADTFGVALWQNVHVSAVGYALVA